MSKKPIRVGFIGLNSRETKAPGGQWARSAHWPYLSQSPEYTITALCNSSVQAAQAAIERHGLDPAKVRAYGDPDSLARDHEVDLVVCCVQVTQHYNLIKPALLAGKMAFCEWPLASNLSQMQELADLASTKNIRTIVGLQGRNGAYKQAIRNVLGDGPGKIGQALSTSMTTYSLLYGLGMPESLTYMTNIESGGNLVTISAIHLLDTMTAALGEIQSFNSVLKNKRPTFALVDENFQVVKPVHPNSTPEHIFVHGQLAGEIPFDFQVRGGKAFKDTPVFDWRIYCEKGEIRIHSMSGTIWMGGGLKMEVYDFVTDKVETIDLDKVLDDTDAARVYGLQAPADNVARLYDAFARGQTDQYLDFKQSLKWAEFIQKLYDDAAIKA